MQTYTLSEEAKTDLIEIAQYTLNRWGKKQFNQYKDGLKNKFEAIANKTAQQKPFSTKLPEVSVSKYKYHYIFSIQHKNKPLIIAIIHEKRDILRHLENRLNR